MKEIKVAILGYGGIARAHMGGYNFLKKEGTPLRVVAMCDIDPAQFEKDVAINIETEAAAEKDYRTYTDLDEMLAKEEIDMVDICLPTYLHKEYTIRMLRAGKHVQCEKPMALHYEDCLEMLEAAKESGKHLMIGQVLRFEAPFLAVKKALDSGKYGKVLTARFERLSLLPHWGWQNWFQDYEKSGGEMMDMSIHDYDIARYLFGEPKRVSAVTCDRQVREQTSNGRLYYDDGMIVTVDGSWAEGNTFPFSCPFRIVCEHATIAWPSMGSPVLVYPNEGEKYALPPEPDNYMANQSRYYAEVLLGQRENDKNPPESAAKTIALIERLKESAAQDGAILAF